MTLIRTTLLLAALLARAQAADPVWVPLDGSPPGTPAQIVFDAPASGVEDAWFDIFIHGFWREDIQPGDGFTYQRIEVPGLGHLTQLGAPDLPVARVRLAVPTSATKVTLASVTDLDPRVFGAMLPYPWVVPALDEAFDPGANPGPGDPDGVPAQFVKDGGIYGGVNAFPATPGTAAATVRKMLGGLPGAVSAVHPASWNPGTGVLSISAHLRVHLQMIGVPQPSPAITKDRAALAGATFLNWPDMGPWFPVNTTVFHGRYLVVASKHRLVTLQPLIDHRKARGFSVEALELESLPVVSCDAIRTGIAAWLGGGSVATDHYVLLVGDSSEIPLCPSPAGAAPSDDRYGSPVDGDGDPEVWVGRLSVDDNADLARQIAKVIAYAADTSSHHDEALLVAHAQGAPGGYQALQEAVAAAPYADAPAFKKVYGAAAGSDALDVRAVIDAGTGLVAYRGHGTQATWADWNLPGHDFHKNQVLALKNPDLPVVWSFACWNSDLGFAPLGTQDSLGETWLEHPSGAVAHYGATGQVSTVENDALERALFRGLYDRGLTRHAQLIAFGEQQISDELAGPGAWAALLLGDPAQRVRRKDPVPLFLELPEVVPVCAGPSCLIVVRVTTTGGVPVAGALVALHKNGPPGQPDDILVNGYTGSSGLITFNVGPADMTAVIGGTGSDPDGNEATGMIGVSDGVWANFGSATPGAKGDAVLIGDGPLSPLSAVKLDVVNAAESAQAGLFISLGSTPVPFQGGTLLANPWIVLLPLLTDPQGELHLLGTWPSGLPSDLEFWFQLAISDAAATSGVALSNAMRGTTP